MFPELEMRFAFERDMVRRKGYKAFSPSRHGIMECVDCHEDFDQHKSQQVRCPTCQIIERRRQKREWKRRNQDQTYTTVNEVYDVSTPDHWTNLMLAIVKQAAEDGETNWLEDNQELYTRAILGRSLDG